MDSKAGLGIIAGLVFISLLVVGAAGGEEPSEDMRLVMEEVLFVPDSVYEPDNGIDFDWKVWWWRWRNGLTEKKPPFNTANEYYDRGELGGPLDEEEFPPPLPLQNRPTEPKYFSWEHFTVIRAKNEDHVPTKKDAWLVEEEIKPTDSDTLGAYFRFSPKRGWFQPMNSRYRLILYGDTVMTFMAGSSRFPNGPIQDTRLWDDGYSFLYQRNGNNRSSLHSVVDGKDLNDLGYENTTAASFLDEKLFFLFERNSMWGWSYDGVEHPAIWERVYYSYGDGESGPNASPRWSAFTALRGGMWYEVRAKLVQ